MANGDHSDWVAIFWEGIKYLLAGLGTAASTVCIWIGARYRGDRAMLLRHENKLNANDQEFGTHKTFRESAAKGPIGEGLNAVINELKQEDRNLHRRISRNRQRVTRVDRRQAQMETDIKWIRRHLENGHRKNENEGDS